MTSITINIDNINYSLEDFKTLVTASHKRFLKLIKNGSNINDEITTIKKYYDALINQNTEGNNNVSNLVNVEKLILTTQKGDFINVDNKNEEINTMDMVNKNMIELEKKTKFYNYEIVVGIIILFMYFMKIFFYKTSTPTPKIK